MQEFGFGPDANIQTRRAGPRQVPRFGVHLQCAWRIVRASAIVVAAWDHEETEVVPGASKPWGFRDARLDDYHLELKRTVVACEVSNFGDLKLVFSDSSVLEVFVDGSREDRECYRLIDVLGDHVVVSGGPRVDVVGLPSSA